MPKKTVVYHFADIQGYLFSAVQNVGHVTLGRAEAKHHVGYAELAIKNIKLALKYAEIALERAKEEAEETKEPDE